MTAARIMLIRHAEKPSDDGKIHGVDVTGEKDHESLSVRGWQRAGAISALFTNQRGRLSHKGLSIPDQLYATAHGHENHSRRPVHTLLPLRERLGLPVNIAFEDKDTKGLLRSVALASDQTVLICWHHEQIPHVAAAILGTHEVAPTTWPDERFDVIWCFDWDRDESGYHFSQIPMELLSGDLREGIQ